MSIGRRLSCAIFDRGGSVGRERVRALDGSGAPAARRYRVLAVGAVVTAGLLGFSVSGASAANLHVFSSSFGSQGSGAGQVSSPQGVAVNSATGDVYVADAGNARVDEFSASGTFVRAWGWGVADGGASFETCTTTCQAGVSGSGAGQFTSPVFISVDNSGGSSEGDVYVADTGDDLVTKFDASGTLISSWGNASTPDGQLSGAATSSGTFAGLTVDPTGNLWVYDLSSTMFEFGQAGGFIQSWNSGRGALPGGLAAAGSGNLYVPTNNPGVTQFTSSGSQVGDVDDAYFNVTGIGVDPTGPDIYVDDGGQIHHYDPSCNPAVGCTPNDFFGSGTLSGGAAGVAVNSASDVVYVADPAANQIDVFAGELLPDVATSAPSNLQPTSATLNGSVDPAGNGTVTACQFEYVDNAGYNPSAADPYSAGQTVACSPSTPYTTATPVSADISSLTPNTLYHFRLDATNANGTNRTQDGTFTTPTTPAIDGESTTNVTRTGATLQAQINPNGLDTTCTFEFGTDTTYSGGSVPCTPTDLGSGFGDQSVSADLTGLTLNTTYHYRVVATNSAGTTDGADQTFTTQPAVQIVGEAAVNVTATQAELEAALNVFGTTTTYHFEYGPTASYGTVVPIPDATPGSGADPQQPTDTLTGLSPNTTYHFRIVATNSFGTVTGPDSTFTTSPATTCPNAQFRVGPSANLPDCRAYELVTPADKGAGYDLFTAGGEGQGNATVSTDGSRVLLGNSFAKFPEVPTSDPVTSYYLFSRGASGWQIKGIKPAGAPGNAQYETSLDESSYGYGIWSPDLTHFGVAVTPEASNVGAGLTWQVGPFGGPYQTVAGPADLPGTGAQTDEFLDATPDFSHVLLASMDHSLAPGASGTVAGASDLYDYTGGSLHLVNVTTGGTLVSPCGATVYPEDNQNLAYTANWAHAISSDGSKVFFASPDPLATQHGATDPSCSDPPQLYMRDQATGTTVEVSAPQGGIVDPDGPQPAYYVGASADGSKVLFETTAELTPDDAGIHDFELYEYDTDTGTLTRIGRGMSGTADANAVQPVISSDGSTVYFQSSAQLTSNAPSNPAGTDIYRYDTLTGVTTYVTTAYLGLNGDGIYTTPDGRFLLFGVQGALLGVDHSVYRYDSSDGSVICISCRPDGAPSDGWSLMTPDSQVENVDTSNDARSGGNVPNPISTDGRYAFFVSDDEILPQDTNGTGGHATNDPWQDVYEWEADGTGGCTAGDGCVHLLSTGTGDQGSVFLGATADGSNAFIGTHSQLVAQDTDQLGDIYDVRIDGGFPSPASPAQCSGDGCQGPLGGTPSLPTAATVSFSGPGDASPGGAAGKASVVSRTVRGASFLVVVRVPGRGRVTISGQGIGRASRSVGRAGTYRLRVTLSSRMRRLLARRHRLRLRLGVSFAPPGAAAETVRVQLLVERAVSHHVGRAR